MGSACAHRHRNRPPRQRIDRQPLRRRNMASGLAYGVTKSVVDTGTTLSRVRTLATRKKGAHQVIHNNMMRPKWSPCSVKKWRRPLYGGARVVPVVSVFESGSKLNSGGRETTGSTSGTKPRWPGSGSAVSSAWIMSSMSASVSSTPAPLRKRFVRQRYDKSLEVAPALGSQSGLLRACMLLEIVRHAPRALLSRANLQL